MVDTCPSEVFESSAIPGCLILLRDVMIGAPYRDAGYSQGDGCLILLRDVTTGAPPLGLFVVLRSRRVTFCFLLLAGCFVFMGTLCFCFCGYDLLKGLARTPKVTRRPPRTFSVGMRSSKRMAGFG